MTIVGAGFNSPAQNAAWIEDQNYQYEVWTDANEELADYYGAEAGLLGVPQRVTVILDAEGTLVLEYRQGTGSNGHPQDVLEDCQLLFGN